MEQTARSGREARSSYRIALINAGFAALNLPSIALTQLKSVVDKEFGERVSVDIFYLNHDLARYLDFSYYEVITEMGSHNGLGDWFFRQVAFPELADNAESYFQRYFPYQTEGNQRIKASLLEKRQGLEPFLDTLIDKYQLDRADLVGFTSMFSQNTACFALARKIKQRNPDVVMVIGGANCEWPMGLEIARHLEQIDFVFSGPALKSFPRLVRHCLNEEIEKCSEIPGVFSKTNYQHPPAVLGEELPIDVEVSLDYESFLQTVERNFPNNEIKPSLLFETSRGCWWGMRAHCTFCGLNGMSMNYRAMQPEKAVELIQSLLQYSPRVLMLQSVDNIMPKNYLAEVFPKLEIPPEMIMFYEVKADLSAQDMQILSRARVKLIQPGIEALATSTLKLMKKGTTAFQNLTFLKNCVTYNLSPVWNLLVGFPGEEEEVYKNYLAAIPLLLHLPPPSGAFRVRFDRFSPYYVQAQEYGLDLRPKDYYGFTYPFDEAALTNLAYFFSDHSADATYHATASKWIDRLTEAIRCWRGRWKDNRQLLRPQLYFKGEAEPMVVYDSRSGQAIEHQVGPVGKQVLESLLKPRRITDLSAHLEVHFGASADFAPAQVEREVTSLQERGLVFQEGERFMSLVLPQMGERQREERPQPALAVTSGTAQVV